MIISLFKRCFLIAIIVIPLANASNNKTLQTKPSLIQEKLNKLESSFDGKIGIYAIDTSNNKILDYRANERFPIQSTMKVIGVAALLKLSEDKDKNFLQENINYTKDDLVYWCPVTKNYISSGMTLESLAEAAVTYSDNTAINVIMKKFGGPKFATSFAHLIGNKSFNVIHYDGYMNSNPKIVDDTSTPKDMAISIQKLTLEDALAKPQQQKLITWMRNTVTSYKTIKAGVPLGWAVADKTGSGDYGVRNDIGIMWSPSCKPIVLAIYTVRNKKEEKSRDDIVASVTGAVFDEFEQYNSCFKN